MVAFPTRIPAFFSNMNSWTILRISRLVFNKYKLYLSPKIDPKPNSDRKRSRLCLLWLIEKLCNHLGYGIIKQNEVSGLYRIFDRSTLYLSQIRKECYFTLLGYKLEAKTFSKCAKIVHCDPHYTNKTQWHFHKGLDFRKRYFFALDKN